MPGYGQFCPVAKAAEVFAERWTPLIMREVLLGSRHFNELERGLPRISRSVLAQRLKALERDGLIERRAGEAGRSSEYVATPAGQELFDVIQVLGVWGARWMNREVQEEDIDTDLLMWDMHRRIDIDRLPGRRVVVEVQFTGLSDRRYWLVLERSGASVCVTHPGFEIDLTVTADTMTLHRVWIGHQELAAALRMRSIEIDGPPDLCRAFPTWLQMSMFAHVAPVKVPA